MSKFSTNHERFSLKKILSRKKSVKKIIRTICKIVFNSENKIEFNKSIENTIVWFLNVIFVIKVFWSHSKTLRIAFNFFLKTMIFKTQNFLIKTIFKSSSTKLLSFDASTNAKLLINTTSALLLNEEQKQCI